MIDNTANTTKEKIDKLTAIVRGNSRIILDVNNFLFDDVGMIEKDSSSINSLDTAIAFLCDEVCVQRELLLGIRSRLGANPSENVCER